MITLTGLGISNHRSDRMLFSSGIFSCLRKVKRPNRSAAKSRANQPQQPPCASLLILLIGHDLSSARSRCRCACAAVRPDARPRHCQTVTSHVQHRDSGVTGSWLPSESESHRPVAAVIIGAVWCQSRSCDCSSEQLLVAAAASFQRSIFKWRPLTLAWHCLAGTSWQVRQLESAPWVA
jgi:hypothetical protein